MMQDLNGKRLAILTTHGFEWSELAEPQSALKEAGVIPHVIASSRDEVRGWDKTDWGESVAVDVALGGATASDYDALLLPGGVINADHLRMDRLAVALVREFLVHRKPVAAICHAPWMLIEAGGVNGRRVTSYPSLKTDLENAGARWVDEEVVIEGNVVTSRRPADLPAFIAAFADMIATGIQDVERGQTYTMSWEKAAN